MMASWGYDGVQSGAADWGTQKTRPGTPPDPPEGRCSTEDLLMAMMGIPTDPFSAVVFVSTLPLPPVAGYAAGVVLGWASCGAGATTGGQYNFDNPHMSPEGVPLAPDEPRTQPPRASP